MLCPGRFILVESVHRNSLFVVKSLKVIFYIFYFKFHGMVWSPRTFAPQKYFILLREKYSFKNCYCAVLRIFEENAARAICRDPVGTESGPSRDPVGTQSGPSRDPVGTQSGPSRDPVGTQSGGIFYMIKIQLKTRILRFEMFMNNSKSILHTE